MLSLDILGRKKIILRNILLDLNGTLATDGTILDDTLLLLKEVGEILRVYILTADTLGSATRLQEQGLKKEIKVLAGENVAMAKGQFLEGLGNEGVIAIGNGTNDTEMLKKADIGIAVLGREGCSAQALRHADLLVKNIDDALQMVLRPQRIVAGLRG